MDLKNLFDTIKKTFTVQRKVDFDDMDLHVVLEPLTALEEVMVLEACNPKEGGAYIAELKKNSLAFSIKEINEFKFYDRDIEYPDENGKVINESKYLFLAHQIETWPVALRDALFDAFNDIILEVEDIITKKTKFKRFGAAAPVTVETDSEKQSAGIPAGFRKIEEPKEPEPANETERLNQQVKKEAEMVESHMVTEALSEEQKLYGQG
jgi:hypothetical protein